MRSHKNFPFRLGGSPFKLIVASSSAHATPKRTLQLGLAMVHLARQKRYAGQHRKAREDLIPRQRYVKDVDAEHAVLAVVLENAPILCATFAAKVTAQQQLAEHSRLAGGQSWVRRSSQIFLRSRQWRTRFDGSAHPNLARRAARTANGCRSAPFSIRAALKRTGE